MSKYYADRDASELDEAGGYYTRHVSAMTSEQLYSKSSIAAELGYRDMVIEELLTALEASRDYLGELKTGGPVLVGLVCIIDEAIEKSKQ